jgi:hypothetical protein
MSDDRMAREDEQAKLRSYLAGQSAKLSAGEIRQRIEDAADEFFGGTRPPSPTSWPRAAPSPTPLGQRAPGGGAPAPRRPAARITAASPSPSSARSTGKATR